MQSLLQGACLIMATLWKAEITDDMVKHLNQEQRIGLFTELSNAVEQIASELEVGREFKHE
jgi:hypothetical protein